MMRLFVALVLLALLAGAQAHPLRQLKGTNTTSKFLTELDKAAGKAVADLAAKAKALKTKASPSPKAVQTVRSAPVVAAVQQTPQYVVSQPVIVPVVAARPAPAPAPTSTKTVSKTVTLGKNGISVKVTASDTKKPSTAPANAPVVAATYTTWGTVSTPVVAATATGPVMAPTFPTTVVAGVQQPQQLFQVIPSQTVVAGAQPGVMVLQQQRPVQTFVSQQAQKFGQVSGAVNGVVSGLVSGAVTGLVNGTVQGVNALVGGALGLVDGVVGKVLGPRTPTILVQNPATAILAQPQALQMVPVVAATQQMQQVVPVVAAAQANGVKGSIWDKFQG